MKKNRNGDKKAKNKILKIAGQSLGIMSIGLMLNGIVSPPPASAVSYQELDRVRREFESRMDDESRDAYNEVQNQAEQDGIFENTIDTLFEAFTGS